MVAQVIFNGINASCQMLKVSILISELYLGFMECMGNLLCNLWWWHSRKKQDHQPASLV